MKNHLERLRGNVAKARAALKSAVATEQQTCKHADLEECDYMPMNFSAAMPPMRVCCDCGMTEEGWGCGYVVLKGDARTISRDSLYAKRQGFAIQDTHKGALLRREVTLAQLVASDE